MRVNIISTTKKKAEARFNSIQDDDLTQLLKNASFTDMDKWVDKHVTTISEARFLFKKILIMLSYLFNNQKL